MTEEEFELLRKAVDQTYGSVIWDPGEVETLEALMERLKKENGL